MRDLIAQILRYRTSNAFVFDTLRMASQLLTIPLMQKQKKPLVLKPDTQLKELTVQELDKVVGGNIPRLNGSGGTGGTKFVPPTSLDDQN